MPYTWECKYFIDREIKDLYAFRNLNNFNILMGNKTPWPTSAFQMNILTLYEKSENKIEYSSFLDNLLGIDCK